MVGQRRLACLAGVRLELRASPRLWRDSWGSLSFFIRCAEKGDFGLTSLKACSSRDQRIFHLEHPLFLQRKLPELLPGCLDSGVSNEDVASDRCSLEDMLLEFRGVVGRSGRTKGSDRDHLYFFLKNVNIEV